jgi:hypothetical protein
MWYPAEIVLSSYLPPELEVGMLFTNRISVGVIEPFIELFELEEIPEDPDAFMAKYGVPVKLGILINDKDIIATHEEIGWWDEGEHTDELRDITLDDINYLLREFDGYVDIEIDDEEEDSVYPIIMEGRVVLSLVPEEDDDDWDETLNDGLEEE